MRADRLSLTFAALADPTRRAILGHLSRGELSVTDLAAPYDMSLPAISKHLRVLERSGLIERTRDAQWRPCRLRARPLKDAADWLQDYHRFWEPRPEGAESYPSTIQTRKPAAGSRATGKRTARR